jgi:hypothetical protein
MMLSCMSTVIPPLCFADEVFNGFFLQRSVGSVVGNKGEQILDNQKIEFLCVICNTTKSG